MDGDYDLSIESIILESEEKSFLDKIDNIYNNSNKRFYAWIKPNLFSLEKVIQLTLEEGIKTIESLKHNNSIFLKEKLRYNIRILDICSYSIKTHCTKKMDEEAGKLRVKALSLLYGSKNK